MAKCLGVSVVCPVLFKQPKQVEMSARPSWLEVALSLHDEIQINLAYVFLSNRTSTQQAWECHLNVIIKLDG